MITFGQRIKLLRTDCNLTQEYIAKKFAVDRTTWNKWEKGTSSPDRETIKKIADFFKVSADFLLGIDDDGFEFLLMKELRRERNLMSAEEKRFLLEMNNTYIRTIRYRRKRNLKQASSTPPGPESDK